MKHLTPFLLLLLALPLLSRPAPARADEPPVAVEVVDEAPASISLVATDRPVVELVEAVALRMGFRRVEDAAGAASRRLVSCRFERRPGWECLAELALERGLDLDVSHHEPDAVVLRAARWPHRRWRAAGGLLVVLGQSRPGTPARTGGPVRHPDFSIDVLGEPRLAWQLAQDLKVARQLGADGAPCDLIRLRRHDGRTIYPNFGQDAADPWPGVSAAAISGTLERTSRALVATRPGLAHGMTFGVRHGGIERARVDEVSRDARHGFDDVVVSFPLGARLDLGRVELQDGDGVPIPADIVTRLHDDERQSFRYRWKHPSKWPTQGRLAAAGGLANVRLVLRLPLEVAKEPLEVVLDRLLE